MRLITASFALALVAAAANATIVNWSQSDLAVSAGNAVSRTTLATPGGEVLNTSTANGALTTIGSGTFAGIWFSQNTIADGTYTLDFNGQVATSISMTVNAISGNGALPGEAFDQWNVAGGVTGYGVAANAPLTVTGATLATLRIDADQGLDNGVFTITFTNLGGMTGFSFRHTQNPAQNGSVIIDVTADIVPAPATGALALFGILAAGRRRR